MGLEATPSIRVYSLSISTTESPPLLPVESSVPPDPHKINLLLLPHQVARVSFLNGYSGLYSYDLDKDPVFQEIVSSNKTVNTINKYVWVPSSVALVSTPTKVKNKRHNTICRKYISTIKRAQSYITVSERLLSTALHSVSQDIISSHTEKCPCKISLIQTAVQTPARPEISYLITLPSNLPPYIKFLCYIRQYKKASYWRDSNRRIQTKWNNHTHTQRSSHSCNPRSTIFPPQTPPTTRVWIILILQGWIIIIIT